MPRTDDPEKLKTFIAENPDHPQAQELKRRIEDLEAQKALADGSPYALRSFLSRWPASAAAIEVRQKLEQLEWQKVMQADAESDYRNFLADWPAGTYAEAARRRLAELKCARLLASGRLEELEAAGRTERLVCREQLRQRALELRYQQAVEAPCCGEVLRFLRRYGRSAQARELRRQLVLRRVEELLQAARFDQADQIAAQYALEAQVVERIRAARSRWQTAVSLADPFLFEDWQEPSGAVPADACRRRQLARRLGSMMDEQAAAILYGLIDDAFLEVRREAVLGLRRLLRSLGPARAAGWLDEKFSQMDESAAPPLRVALLRWLAGDGEEALSLLRALAAESATGDVFVLWLSRQVAAELAGGRPVPPAGDFRRAASAFAESRMKAWEEARRRGEKAAASLLRQLCALAWLWRETAAAADSPAEFTPAEAGGLTLADLERWLREQEKTAAADATCGSCLTGKEAMEEERAAPPAAIFRLQLLPDLVRWPLLEWSACCHPRQPLRHAARLLLAASALLEGSGLHWPLWLLAF